jgi:hypothetical protein
MAAMLKAAEYVLAGWRASRRASRRPAEKKADVANHVGGRGAV